MSMASKPSPAATDLHNILCTLHRLAETEMGAMPIDLNSPICTVLTDLPLTALT
jgi:hypothetical protein